jgi:transcriptional regulator with XRE-family HTH domain
MKIKGLKQREIAEALNLAQTTISRKKKWRVTEKYLLRRLIQRRVQELLQEQQELV